MVSSTIGQSQRLTFTGRLMQRHTVGSHGCYHRHASTNVDLVCFGARHTASACICRQAGRNPRPQGAGGMPHLDASHTSVNDVPVCTWHSSDEIF